MDSRIKLVKVQSGWGNTSWNAYVDGVFIGNCRLKNEAKQVAESHLVNKAEQDKQWLEDMKLEYDE